MMGLTEHEKVFNPLLDGVTHINIHCKGRTSLGRMLDTLADLPFRHPELGTFCSVEGAYWWRATGQRFPWLCSLSGYKVRAEGRQLYLKLPERERLEVSLEFLCQMSRLKIFQNPELRAELVDQHLPLVSYSIYGKSSGRKRVVALRKDRNLAPYITQLRLELLG